ncbi:uracil-DNA glycosylase family protein [Sphingomonas sp. MMS12-HWE2-04]|uniref:uracil-DNA glycosylase family protein n=1 Tax=Sphingomonas sp. MMS12-HWE2-04 TaxID=3234199 RepID=UPI00384E283E
MAGAALRADRPRRGRMGRAGRHARNRRYGDAAAGRGRAAARSDARCNRACSRFGPRHAARLCQTAHRPDPPDDEQRLVELARHQLGLVRPKRLLLLGQAASRVLAETNAAGPDNRIHAVNHFGARTAVVASYHPRFLLERPAAKSEAWKHLLLLSRGLAE